MKVIALRAPSIIFTHNHDHKHIKHIPVCCVPNFKNKYEKGLVIYIYIPSVLYIRNTHSNKYIGPIITVSITQ